MNDTLLRDQLAADRTTLANERTLLAYFRTAIMLFVSGITLIKFFDDRLVLEVTGYVISVGAIAVALVGHRRFMRMRNTIQERVQKVADAGC